MEHARVKVQPQVIITSNKMTSSNADGFQLSAGLQMKALFILRIMVGSLSLMMRISLGLVTWFGYFRYMGAGLWAGAYLMIIGGSLKISSRNSGNWMVASKIQNILSTSLFCAAVVGIKASSCALDFCGRMSVGSSGDKALLLLVVAPVVITLWSVFLCEYSKPLAETLTDSTRQPRKPVYQSLIINPRQSMVLSVKDQELAGVHDQQAKDATYLECPNRKPYND